MHTGCDELAATAGGWLNGRAREHQAAGAKLWEAGRLRGWERRLQHAGWEARWLGPTTPKGPKRARLVMHQQATNSGAGKKKQEKGMKKHRKQMNEELQKRKGKKEKIFLTKQDENNTTARATEMFIRGRNLKCVLQKTQPSLSSFITMAGKGSVIRQTRERNKQYSFVTPMNHLIFFLL